MKISYLTLRTKPLKHFLVGFLALWSACSLASGWNDFQRDIGHGFVLWKASSFHVCIDQRVGSSDRSFYTTQVCGDINKGDYGPVSGYFFTDTHLLVRTHGAKRSGNDEYFTRDTAREHFFILPKKTPQHDRQSVIKPLDRDEFYGNPAVPTDIQWQRPTRFYSSPGDESDTSLIIDVISPS